MTCDLARAVHAAGEHRARKAAVFVANDPALEAVYGALVGARLVVHGGGEKVRVSERVIACEERVHAVKQGLELAAHFVAVDRRCENEHVRVQHLLGNLHRVVVYHAMAELLTCEASATEADVLPAQGNFLYLVASGRGALGEGVRQRFGIAVRAQAGAYNENLFGHMSYLRMFRLILVSVDSVSVPVL